ncbi:MAG: hypothetical protein J5I90_11020 [Caldilineales bacterium]|nr:hypothetical protein [Caldilineales bacterium]
MSRISHVITTILILIALGSNIGPDIVFASSQDPPPLTQAAVFASDANTWQTFLPLAARRYSTIPPLNVTPTLDESRAVSRETPLTGGEISAIAANGVRFTLSIPNNALVITTTITMTPLSAIADLPADELIGAVTLEPADLFLYQPARLSIEPPHPLPVAQELSFSFYEGGADFHRYPLLPDEPGVMLPVIVLRSYGLARQQPLLQVSKSRPTNAPTYRPAIAEAQLQQTIADIIHEMRTRTEAGLPPDPSLDEQIQNEFDKYYDQFIKPLLVSMHEGCPSVASVQQALGWARQMQLLGQGDDTEQQAAVSAATEAALQNCLRKAAEPCFDFDWDRKIGDPEQIALVLGYERQMQLLGNEVPSFNELPRCPIVDVRLDSTGAFQYEIPPDPETGWYTKVHLVFPDDTVSGVGLIYPFNAPSIALGVNPAASTAAIMVRVKKDDVWEEVPEGVHRDSAGRSVYDKNFYCRDRKVDRVQEMIITISHSSGNTPGFAPRVNADNIGCWRWQGSSSVQQQSHLDIVSTQIIDHEFTGTAQGILFERIEPDRISFKNYGTYFVISDSDFAAMNQGTTTFTDRHYLWRKHDGECESRLQVSDLPIEPAYSSTVRVSNVTIYTGSQRRVMTGGLTTIVDKPYEQTGNLCDNFHVRLETQLAAGISTAIDANGRQIYSVIDKPVPPVTMIEHYEADLTAQRE